MNWNKLSKKIPNRARLAEVPPIEFEQALAGLLNITEKTNPAGLEHHWHDVIKRIRDAIRATSEELIGREAEIEAVAASFVSGVPTLLMGPPGTAKSAIVSKMAKHCGVSRIQLDDVDHAEAKGDGPMGGYFEYLMTDHTMPEHLFGGVDLTKLDKGRIIRVTRGKLPEAEIVFLDEIFRGGGHILNTLLTIINEKRFDAGKGSEPVPFLALVGAANRAPHETDLEAFFDRFPVRVWVDSVIRPHGSTNYEPENARSVASEVTARSLRNECDRLIEAWDREGTVSHFEPTSCTNDFRFARAYLLHCLRRKDEKPLSEDPRFQQFIEFFHDVNDEVRLSDRALFQLWSFGAALDLVRERDPSKTYPGPDGHLLALRHVARNSSQAQRLGEKFELKTVGMDYTGEH